MSKKALALVLSAVLASNTGCSLIFMSKAPEPLLTPNYPVECTSSVAAPILDSICTGYFVANTAVLAGKKDCSDNATLQDLEETCVENKGAGMALSAGLGAICLIGAMSGFGKAQQCKAVKAQNALCITGNQDSCKALNPNWRPTVQPAAAPAPAFAPPPEQRPDGLPEGADCTATWQCKTGLACKAGACLVP